MRHWPCHENWVPKCNWAGPYGAFLGQTLAFLGILISAWSLDSDFSTSFLLNILGPPTTCPSKARSVTQQDPMGPFQDRPLPTSSAVVALSVSSITHLCPTLCEFMDCSKTGLPVHHQLLDLTQTHVHWIGDAIQPSHPLSSPSPPDLNLSQHQGLFQRVSSLHQVAKDWSFSFSISPSNEYSRLISFRMDWLDLLAF